VYVPARYYHRPRGRDDTHGYGQASRFLTDTVQAMFTITRTARAAGAPAPQTEEARGRQIEVSVDALFC
jgi:DNA helicase-2/ATP-dependent DNA helicase PcrA